MADTTRQRLFRLVQRIRVELDRLEERIEEEIPAEDWLTTKEFAKESGLGHKTVSNYASRRDYGRKQKKNDKGEWLIHRSELS